MVDESSASGAPGATTGKVSLPENTRSPWWELGRRLLLAAAILIGTVLLVYFDRDGYRDSNDPDSNYAVDIYDSIYYTTVTLSTTGYGDIAPVTQQARMVNAFVVTPLRIAFLVLLIGTTLEVLASQGREMFRVARWRKTMGKHVVVVGYGTKGRSAVETIVGNGLQREAIVIVDPSRDGADRRPRRRTGRHHRRRDPPVGAAPGRRRDRRPRSSSPPTATTPTCSRASPSGSSTRTPTSSSRRASRRTCR